MIGRKQLMISHGRVYKPGNVLKTRDKTTVKRFLAVFKTGYLRELQAEVP
jgi:hypothetical protein